MGRAPCCDKANVKKGPWSPEEDAKLKSYIEQHGTGGNWIALPHKIGLKRCGKSCRLRWLNYLRPNIKHGGFSEEEDNIICSLYVSIGSRWSVIAAQLPGRTDNDIKNYWNTRLKKKLLGKHRKEQQQARNRVNTTVKQQSNLVPEIDNSIDQQPYYYWPQSQMPVLLPVPLLPYTNQQGPCFNDQDSIRKLLIKLGGRFSHYDYQYHPTLDDGLNLHQFPVVNTPCPSTQHDIYEEQVRMASSANCMNASIDRNQVQFTQNDDHYSAQVAAAGTMELLVPAQGSFSTAIEEMVSTTSTNTNYPPQIRLNGLEFLYGEEMVKVNHKIVGTGPPSPCSQSTNNWVETSSTLINYPPLFTNSNNNYQGVRQSETPQECVFQELMSYPGAQ